ncbi:MAG: UDP-glucose/GDP-mannose dehydrogenase family protein [Candidatus Lernaella stagnicola]|nr:UDP-glucose/GDP-mannose dehydrogenase family protein [Candidatus Lernaella stagnicola]
MNICVIGTGYVGLVAGTCFAETGHDVICVDKDEEKIAMLNRGEIPIFEPELDTLVERNTKEGRLVFTTDLVHGVQQSSVIFIAVGTPQDEDGSADLSHVLEVAKAIGRAMNEYKIIVDKSTVPVGTADLVREAVAGETDQPFDMVSNPEFMKEGAAVNDFLYPDRVVIGAGTEQCKEMMGELYAPFVRTGNPIIFMDIRSAEMTKYTANAMLATKISFMNEIANLCDAVGADVTAVRRGVGTDTRIGSQFLFPGVGYGGSCFPKDIRALARTAERFGMTLDILSSVDRVNEAQKTVIVRKAKKHFGEDLSGKTFAVWGLSFKPQTDDMREAPAKFIIRDLVAAGAMVRAFDPAAMEEAVQPYNLKDVYDAGRMVLCDNAYEALEGADALIVVTDWNEFRRPNFTRIKEMMNQPVVFDGRNLYTPGILRELGFSYYAIGRDAVN